MIYSLLIGLYKITTESIKLLSNIEQIWASLPRDAWKLSHFFFFFFYTSSLKHSMCSTEMPLSIFSLKSKTGINDSIVLALATWSISFGLTWQVLWQLNFQPSKCISCFSHIFCGISYCTPILFMVVLFSKTLCRCKNKFSFSNWSAIMAHVTWSKNWMRMLICGFLFLWVINMFCVLLYSISEGYKFCE